MFSTLYTQPQVTFPYLDVVCQKYCDTHKPTIIKYKPPSSINSVIATGLMSLTTPPLQTQNGKTKN